MNQATFSRLMELSFLPDAEREAAIDNAPPREIRDYLLALESLGNLLIPEPATSRKWAGRTQLLNEVAAYREKPAPWVLPLSRLYGLRGATVAAAAGAVLLGSVAAASSLTGMSSSNGAFSEVLSALGLRTQTQVETPAVTPDVPRDVPELVPEFAPPVLAPSDDIDVPSDVLEEDLLDPTSQPEQPAALPPGQVLDPPAQGVDPPGQGGEDPGQGVEPPGQGGENPGQGVDPPGQGGENPGQGVDPPGQGAENPGQGVDPPGQDEENPGQGSDPPGHGSGNGNGSGNVNGD